MHLFSLSLFQIKYCQLNKFFLNQKTSMDTHPFYRYADSQDHVIISLNQQIQNIIPLKQSYSALQRCHLKLTQDLESLILDHQQVSEVYITKVKELAILNEQLDNKKTRYVEEIRKMENDKAKLILQRKNLMCTCETLGSKFNLENQQNVLQQDRARELIEVIKKTEQGIEVFRRVIDNLENQIRIRNMEKTQLEDEINRRKIMNEKLANTCGQSQSKLQKTDTENRKIVDQNSSLDQEISQIEIQIREQIIKGKELSEESIKKREELANLYNQKEYYCRLIESQLIIKEDLEISSQKLSLLVQKRTQELNKIKNQNEQIQRKIEEEQTNLRKNNEYKLAMKNHLAQLIQANSLLLESMEEFCGEDQKTHKLLNSKVKRLELSCEKVKNVNESKQQKRRSLFKDRINESKYDTIDYKRITSTGKSWINELKDLQNLGIR